MSTVYSQYVASLAFFVVPSLLAVERLMAFRAVSLLALLPIAIGIVMGLLLLRSCRSSSQRIDYWIAVSIIGFLLWLVSTSVVDLAEVALGSVEVASVATFWQAAFFCFPLLVVGGLAGLVLRTRNSSLVRPLDMGFSLVLAAMGAIQYLLGVSLAWYSALKLIQ